jgi:hypothetical protein
MGHDHFIAQRGRGLQLLSSPLAKFYLQRGNEAVTLFI